MRRQKCQKSAEWIKWAKSLTMSTIQFEFYVDYRKKFAHKVLIGYVFLKPAYVNLKFNSLGYKAKYNVFVLGEGIYPLNKVKHKTVKFIDNSEVIVEFMVQQLEKESVEGV